MNERFTLPYPPSTNRYWRNYRGRMVKSDEARQYQQLAWLLAKQAVPEPLGGPVALSLRFYRPQRRGDLDNRIKIVLDALQGALFANDSQVTEIHAYQDDDKQRPRVEIQSWEPGQMTVWEANNGNRTRIPLSPGRTSAAQKRRFCHSPTAQR